MSPSVHGSNQRVNPLRVSTDVAIATVSRASVVTGLMKLSMSDPVVYGGKMRANTCCVKCYCGKHIKKKYIPT